LAKFIRGTNFRQHVLHERLAAETRFDGHDEEDVKLPEVGIDRTDRRVWIDGQSRLFARRADPGECLGHIGFGFKVDIHGMRHRKVRSR